MAPTVADALLDQLADHGVRVCFGVPGVHNLPLWVGAGVGRRPRIVGVRHEQAAGYAADASARATGGLGVAITTTGPGFANALAAFGEAWASFSPVLLLSSEAPLGPRRRTGADHGLLHSMRSQADMVSAGFGARAVSAADGASAVAALPQLVAHAIATGRPVYLGVPADILASSWTAPNPPPLPRDRTAPAAADVTAAADALRGRRVVIWLGARAVAAETDVRRLADRLDALVVTTFQARGMLADHPGTITAPPHEPRVSDIIGSADALLVIGDDLAGMTTRNWTMRVPSTIVALTDDADASLGDYPLAARLTGHIATGVRDLVDALGDKTSATAGADGDPDGSAPRDEDGGGDDGAARDTDRGSGDGSSITRTDSDDVGSAERHTTGSDDATHAPHHAARAITAAVWADVRADERTAPGAGLVATVEEGWFDAGALVVDMCVAGYWLGGYSRQPRARRLQYPVGWGTLGYALPAAIGPAAHGIPTLAVVGDGGAAMGLGELATFAQERLPVSVLVVTDGGYGMLRYDQDVAGDPHRGVDLVEPRWDDLAAAYGMRVMHTDDPGAGLARALTQARDGLTCGDRWMVVLEAALFPPRTTSPRWREH